MAADFPAAGAGSPVAGATLAAAVQEEVGEMKPRAFLNQLDNEKIVAAIRQAEQQTSGEIRVFISRKRVDDPVAAAQAEFERLGMTKTQQRNGVLIFVAPRAHKFAVIGDVAVHQHCGETFWQAVASALADDFKKSDFTSGIVCAIQKIGELFAGHFPHQPDDENELPDQVEHD